MLKENRQGRPAPVNTEEECAPVGRPGARMRKERKRETAQELEPHKPEKEEGEKEKLAERVDGREIRLGGRASRSYNRTCPTAYRGPALAPSRTTQLPPLPSAHRHRRDDPPSHHLPAQRTAPWATTQTRRGPQHHHPFTQSSPLPQLPLPSMATTRLPDSRTTPRHSYPPPA